MDVEEYSVDIDAGELDAVVGTDEVAEVVPCNVDFVAEAVVFDAVVGHTADCVRIP